MAIADSSGFLTFAFALALVFSLGLSLSLGKALLELPLTIEMLASALARLSLSFDLGETRFGSFPGYPAFSSQAASFLRFLPRLNLGLGLGLGKATKGVPLLSANSASFLGITFAFALSLSLGETSSVAPS